MLIFRIHGNTKKSVLWLSFSIIALSLLASCQIDDFESTAEPTGVETVPTQEIINTPGDVEPQPTQVVTTPGEPDLSQTVTEPAITPIFA